MFRQPSLGLAEIAWRWSFGLAFASLVTFSFLEYLDTLPVGRGDLLLLYSRQPTLVSRALADIFRGSSPRVVEVSVVLAITMAAAWIVLASLGRAATLKALLRYFREYAASLEGASASQSVPYPTSSGLRSLCGLNFFRVGVTLAAVVGCLGALLLAGMVSSEKDPSPWSALLVFVVLILLVWLAWSALNWFLSLAAVFVVGRGRDTFGAVASAVDLCRARGGPVFAAGTWFGLTHLAAFVFASSVVVFPLAFLGVLPPALVLGAVLLITLLYFAVADFLYVGRLAAYVAVVELPEAPPAAPAPLPSPAGPPAPLSQPATGIDKEEPILSDMAAESSTQESALATIDRDEPIRSDIPSDVPPPEAPQD
jgi:hypothetical protein